jgi:hypothetical protein
MPILGVQVARSARQGGIGRFHGEGLFWRFCWGDPFLVSAAQDGAAETMIPGSASDDKPNNFKCLHDCFHAYFHESNQVLSTHFI